MNRVEIKNKAKEMYRNNKWFIWKPLLIIGLCLGLIEGIAYGLDNAFGLAKESVIDLFGTKVTYTNSGIISNVVGIFTGFASAALSVGYSMYMLAFVRGEKLEMKDIIEFAKKYWVVSFLVGLLTGLAIFVGLILLVIPGIIASIGLMFYREVCADNPMKKPTEIVKMSWNMTKGHKMDLFVMGLSFLGWLFVAGLTLGIAYIWVMPYMIVTFTLAYEELKKTA